MRPPPLRAFKNVQQYNTDKQNQTNHLDSTNIGNSNSCANTIFVIKDRRICPDNFGNGDGRGTAVYNVFYKGKGSGNQCTANLDEKIGESIDVAKSQCFPLCIAEEKVFVENKKCPSNIGNHGFITKITKHIYENNGKYVSGEKCAKFKKNFIEENRCSHVYVPPQQVANIIDNICSRGGNCSAGLLITLVWENSSDLDLHVTQPKFGERNIYWSNTGNPNRTNRDGSPAPHPPTWSGGILDVDMNVDPCSIDSKYCSPTRPIENVSFNRFESVPDGNYSVYVNNFTSRNPGREKFSIFVAYKKQGEERFTRAAIYDYTGSLANKQSYRIITINKTGDNLKLIEIPPEMQLNYNNGIETDRGRRGNNFL